VWVVGGVVGVVGWLYEFCVVLGFWGVLGGGGVGGGGGGGGVLYFRNSQYSISLQVNIWCACYLRLTLYRFHVDKLLILLCRFAKQSCH